mmetsp:Transcript_6387/g.20302  ORF Transcript_6387/g.20302 Transcript_6387/m.20302 type:complete len:204 (+) Transcript_6387:65-676(+)
MMSAVNGGRRPGWRMRRCFSRTQTRTPRRWRSRSSAVIATRGGQTSVCACVHVWGARRAGCERAAARSAPAMYNSADHGECRRRLHVAAVADGPLREGVLRVRAEPLQRALGEGIRRPAALLDVQRPRLLNRLAQVLNAVGTAKLARSVASSLAVDVEGHRLAVVFGQHGAQLLGAGWQLVHRPDKFRCHQLAHGLWDIPWVH